MSHGGAITRSTQFLSKGKQTKRSKTFFQGVIPQHIKYIWKNKKNVTKDKNNFK